MRTLKFKDSSDQTENVPTLYVRLVLLVIRTYHGREFLQYIKQKLLDASSQNSLKRE